MKESSFPIARAILLVLSPCRRAGVEMILGPSEHHAGELGAPVRRAGTLNHSLENCPATHTQGSAWEEGMNSYWVEPDAGVPCGST